MKVTFVGIGFEHLSISLLSSLAKKHGHQTSLAFFSAIFNDYEFPQFKKGLSFLDNFQSVINSINDQAPEILALTAATNNYQTILRIASEIKKNNPEIKTIIGGPHASAVPERVIVNSNIDYVVIGEGDYAFIQIIDAVEKNDYFSPIDNTWYKNKNGDIIKGIQKGFIHNLDSLPQFDKDLWADYIPHKEYYPTMTSRGCPFRCSYCFNNFFKNIPDEHAGKYLRQRSVEHVMEELISSKKKYNIKYVDFWDDVFTFDKKWLKEFLYRYKKEINVPFQCYSHVQYFDEDIAKMLKESGCEWSNIGVQSLDEEYKRKWLCRNEKNEDIVKTLELMARYKINSKVDMIIGLPCEPIESKHFAVDFYAKHTPVLINFYGFTFFPGTEIIDFALKQEVISKERYENISDGLEMRVYRRFDQEKNKKELKQLQSFSYLYRIYPRLPYFIRTRISAETAEKVPSFIKKILLVIHYYALLSKKDPRTIYLIKHTLFEIKQQILFKLKNSK